MAGSKTLLSVACGEFGAALRSGSDSGGAAKYLADHALVRTAAGALAAAARKFWRLAAAAFTPSGLKSWGYFSFFESLLGAWRCTLGRGSIQIGVA